MDDSVLDIQIVPSQGTDLANPDSGAQTNVNAEIFECEVGLYMLHNESVVRTALNINRMFVAFGRELNVDLPIFDHLIFDTKAEYHSQDDQNILDCFMT